MFSVSNAAKVTRHPVFPAYLECRHIRKEIELSKTRKFLSTVSGADAIATITRAGFGSLTTHKKIIGERSWKSVKSIWDNRRYEFSLAPLLTDASPDPAVRFQQAVEHFDLDEVDLNTRQHATWTMFWLYVLLSAGWIGLAFASLRNGFIPTDVPSFWLGGFQIIFIRWIMCLVLPGLALKHGLVNYQIRNRRLDGFMTYMRSQQIFPRQGN